jgi:hypothetical protein
MASSGLACAGSARSTGCVTVAVSVVVVVVVVASVVAVVVVTGLPAGKSGEKRSA